jgi:hypothetical protein
MLVIVKVNECGTNWLQKMLLQEDMYQVAGMNTDFESYLACVKKKAAKRAIFK